MNDLQKKEFELLKLFVDICGKLNLQYYLVCGSALGAVKYGGFIPWDDDVDVALPRQDYEIFCESAQDLLPDWVFVQNYKTDQQFPKIFTKLRNINTTYVEKEYKNLNICHGVFIDVFPLDGYPQNKKDIKEFEQKKLRYLRQTSSSLSSVRTFKSNLLCAFYHILGYHKRTNKVLTRYEELILKYNSNECSVWCNYGNFRGKMKKIPKIIYGSGRDLFFEGISVKVPEQYDEYLLEFYGDWRADLPPEKQVGHHYYEICDLEHPYTDYIKNVTHDGRKIHLKKSVK